MKSGLVEDLDLKINNSSNNSKEGRDNQDEYNPKNRPKRQDLPEELVKDEVRLEAAAMCPDCGGENFSKIGEDVTKKLIYIPASYVVKKYVRPRCICKNCRKIVQAEMPSTTIDKGKAEASFLAHILTQKYCNHLPFYRQNQMFEREGITIATSTMSSWASKCAYILEILAERIQDYIFSKIEIHGDDTTIKVLEPGSGKTKTARIWSYVYDARPYGSNDPVAVCYFYSENRKKEHPIKHLEGFTGTLQADAYSGYNELFKPNEKGIVTIDEAGCWAHVRRKFVEATSVIKAANIANEVLEQIKLLYAIEKKINGSNPKQRLKIRKAESKKLVEQLFDYMKIAYEKLFKNSATAKAIKYALNNETALKCYLNNGRLEIDNNIAERSMRSIAVGRKNWLFAGSDLGGKSSAIIFTLIETAKLNNVNPWQYLHKVLAIIQDYTASKIDDLLPWNLTLHSF